MARAIEDSQNAILQMKEQISEAENEKAIFKEKAKAWHNISSTLHDALKQLDTVTSNA